MYLKLLLFIIVTVIVSTSLSAQYVMNDQSEVNKETIDFSFVPKHFNLVVVDFKPKKPSSNKNKILRTTGFLLKNLTFNSPYDRFSANLPYDQRVYEPQTFSQLSAQIQTNLLLNKTLIGFLQ